MKTDPVKSPVDSANPKCPRCHGHHSRAGEMGPLAELVRRGRGRYVTLDGAYDVVEDPQRAAWTGDASGRSYRAPRHVWLIYARGEDLPEAHLGQTGWPTLREARAMIQCLRESTKEGANGT